MIRLPNAEQDEPQRTAAAHRRTCSLIAVAPGAQWLREPSDVDRVGQHHDPRLRRGGADLAYVVRECCAGIQGVDEHEGRAQRGNEWERGVNRECLVVGYSAQAFAAWLKPVSVWQELDSFLSLASSRQSIPAARFPGPTTGIGQAPRQV
jgi:hypothetical protein